MERLRQRAKKCRELGKEHAEDPDAPAVADEDGDGEHAEWNKIGLLLLREDIGKPLRHLEDYLNEMPHILGIFGLEKSPDFTTFCNWEKEISMPAASNVVRRALTIASGRITRFRR